MTMNYTLIMMDNDSPDELIKHPDYGAISEYIAVIFQNAYQIHS